MRETPDAPEERLRAASEVKETPDSSEERLRAASEVKETPDAPEERLRAASEVKALTHLVARTEGLQPWRRAFHAASGVVLAWAPRALGLEGALLLGILGALLAVAVLLDVVRLRSERVNSTFFRFLRPFASPREEKGPASSTFYLLGVLLVYAVFPVAIAVPAILVLALADPAASVLGRMFGTRRLGKGSWEGATAFLLVAGTILVAAGFGWPGLLVAALVAGVEVLPTGIDDNLAVPLATALLLQGVGVVFPI